MLKFNHDFKGRRLIAGIGSALVDVLAHEDDAFVAQLGLAKGGMSLVDHAHIEKALAHTSAKPVFVPGGSACNTLIGISRLGGRSRFVGKCGNDKLGNFFQKDLEKNRVEPVLFRSQAPTGRVLSIITPDAQRSMLTFLGASAEIGPEDISAAFFEDAAIVHIEGYLVFNPDLIRAAMQAAKKAGALVCLDLGSFTMVQTAKALLDDLVQRYVDILIANEDEARVFSGYKDEGRALASLARKAALAVLKVGPRGSFIACGGKTISVEPVGSGAVVDTTGAGDLWAAGFLFGLIDGRPLEQCGRLGSVCGYEVCRVVGANISENGWQRIKHQEGI